MTMQYNVEEENFKNIDSLLDYFDAFIKSGWKLVGTSKGFVNQYCTFYFEKDD